MLKLMAAYPTETATVATLLLFWAVLLLALRPAGSLAEARDHHDQATVLALVGVVAVIGLIVVLDNYRAALLILSGVAP